MNRQIMGSMYSTAKYPDARGHHGSESGPEYQLLAKATGLELTWG